MSESAHVHSVESIERFRAALAQFEKRTQSAIDTLNAELQLAINWVERDCPHYWKEQEKLAADAVHQSRLDVERCLTFAVTDERPACREERAALARAQARLRYCREKKDHIKHWQGVMHHEIYEFQGKIGHLRRVLETQLPTARARLQLIIRHVEGYQIERPPESREPMQGVPESTDDESLSGASSSPER